VYTLAVIQSNLNIVSGNYDGYIQIWNSTSFQLITTLYGHVDGVNALAILFNSNIVSCSFDKTIKIWQYKELEYYSNLTGHTGSINDLYFLNNADTCLGYECKSN